MPFLGFYLIWNSWFENSILTCPSYVKCTIINHHLKYYNVKLFFFSSNLSWLCWQCMRWPTCWWRLTGSLGSGCRCCSDSRNPRWNCWLKRRNKRRSWKQKFFLNIFYENKMLKNCKINSLYLTKLNNIHTIILKHWTKSLAKV